MIGETPATEHMIQALLTIVRERSAEMLSVEPDLAALVADEVATEFFRQFGGSSHYIPAGRVFVSTKLHRQIWDEYNGKNIRELRSKYGLSQIYLYRLLARQRDLDRLRRQDDLPGLGSAI